MGILAAIILIITSLLLQPARAYPDHIVGVNKMISLAEANRGNLTTRDYLDGLIMAEAAAHGIDPAVLRGVVRVESCYRIDLVGRYGEIGLMQLKPSTAREMCRRIGTPYSRAMLFEPEYNLAIGCAYLHWCLDRSGGNYREALERYNGFGRGYAGKVLNGK
jgi:soluble lytic murein transglycosylase-like protein